MKTVLMHSYVDEHVHVIGKRFWERYKKKDFRVAFYKVPLRSTLFITTTTLIANQPCSKPGGGTGGDFHLIGAGMLVVSLRGVNFRFWSRLGCSGQNTIIFNRKGLF